MFLCEKCHNKIHSGKISKAKVRKAIKETNESLFIPKNYIQSDNYKKKTQLNKMKYLCNCLNNHKVFSDKDRESVIKYIENLISKKTN